MGGITRVKFSPYDLEALALFIYAYQETLKFPEIFPEHTPRYNAVLDQVKQKCQYLANSPFPMFLTELELVAIDIAAEGFIRLIERTIPEGKREKILAPVTRFREQLATKELPF